MSAKEQDLTADTKERLIGARDTWFKTEKGLGAEFAKVVTHALETIDFEEYEKMRTYHMSDDSSTRERKYKYLDLALYLKSKLRPVLDLQLERTKPLKMLDIGTGAGHFPFICSYYGHDVIGTDIPDGSLEGCSYGPKSEGPEFLDKYGVRDSFYGDIIKLLGVNRQIHRIVPFEPMPDFGKHFDLITGFQVSFDKYGFEERQIIKHLWGFDEWSFFLNDLVDKQLAPEGRVFFKLNRSLDYEGTHFDAPEFAEFIESLGWRLSAERSLLTYGDFEGLA